MTGRIEPLPLPSGPTVLAALPRLAEALRGHPIAPYAATSPPPLRHRERNEAVSPFHRHPVIASASEAISCQKVQKNNLNSINRREIAVSLRSSQ